MQITTTTTTNSYSTRKAYIDAWGGYVGGKLDEGWEGYLITFMFSHIPGSEETRLRVMEREVERVYATLLTRLFRRPHARGNRGKLPIWIVAPDYPVAKHEKTILEDVRVNDGLHLHGAALFHRDSRLETSVEDYLDDNLHILVHGDLPLRRLNLTPIVSEEKYVVGYGFKTVQRRAEFGVNGFIVLPRTSGEIK